MKGWSGETGRWEKQFEGLEAGNRQVGETVFEGMEAGRQAGGKSSLKGWSED